jgi:hypothetical protein
VTVEPGRVEKQGQLSTSLIRPLTTTLTRACLTEKYTCKKPEVENNTKCFREVVEEPPFIATQVGRAHTSNSMLYVTSRSSHVGVAGLL